MTITHECTCPACGKHGAKHTLTTGTGYDIVGCKDCGVVWAAGYDIDTDERADKSKHACDRCGQAIEAGTASLL